MRKNTNNNPKKAFAGHIGYHNVFHPLELLVEPMPILEDAEFCKYAGTKYPCCINKVCFNEPCKVRDFRNKYEKLESVK